MPSDALTQVVRRLRNAALRRDEAGLTDGQLLECFIATRDSAAFEALVRRHGPMVLGVCRRVLGHEQDAEDAFQAAFLVLVHKAASIVPREMVANWLHGVAHNTALKARAMSIKRRGRERQVAEMPEPETMPADFAGESHRVLDKALRGLSETYRVPLILCELEGKTYKEAARQLGVSEGTISVRLVRARKMLAKRLTGHGVVLSAGSLATILSPSAASASVPATLVGSTVKAASVSGLGQAVATGAISLKVAVLTKGVLKSMLLTKLKSLTALLLVVGIVGTGAGVLAFQSQAASPRSSTLVQSSASATVVNELKVPTDNEAIQGTWAVVRLDQINHEPSKEERAYWESGQFKLAITADRLIYPDQSEGRYTLDPTKQPKEMEVTTVVNGITMAAPAIYSLQGDDLRICMGRGGDRERPAEFDIAKAKPGTFPTCWTLKRARNEPKGSKVSPNPSTAADPTTKDDEKLQGPWQAISGETANEKLPAAVLQGIKMTFAGAKVSLTRGAASGDASVTLDPTKTPKEIDLVASDGSHSIGIYELDKDRLKICMVEAKGESRPTEFGAKDKQVLITFQRVDPSKADPASEKRAEAPAPADRVLQEEVTALKAALKGQEAVNGRLKDELAAARKELSAVLKKVDIAKNTIDVTLGDTTLRIDAIPLASGAKFYLDGNECRIDELKEGMAAKLALGADAEKSQAVAVRAVSPKGGQEK